MNQPFSRRFGDGAAEFLFIHCTLARSGALGRFAERLGHSAVAIDLPGHGHGPEVDPAQGFLDQTLELAMAALPAHPVHLFGHSFGAVTAMRLALDNPGRVKSLSLFEPVLFAAVRGEPIFEDYCAQIAPFDKAMQSGDLDAAADWFLGLWGGGNMRLEQREAAIRLLPTVTAQNGTLFRDTSGLLAGRHLENFEIPVLLISGSASPPITAAINLALGDRFEISRERVVDGAGHMGPITHADVVAAIVSDFVDDI